MNSDCINNTQHDIAMVSNSRDSFQRLAIGIQNSPWNYMPFSRLPLVVKHMAQEVVA